jgi:hypothetical protein
MSRLARARKRFAEAWRREEIIPQQAIRPTYLVES